MDQTQDNPTPEPTNGWGRWEWPDIGVGRQHYVVSISDGVIETAEGPKDTKVAVLSCGRIRPIPYPSSLTPDLDLDAPVHAACQRIAPKLRARDSADIGVLLIGLGALVGQPVVEQEPVAEPVH